MRLHFRLAILAATAALAAACQSTPEPVVTQAPPPAPPPVVAPPPAPPPAPVVVERTGPLPGSVQDFAVNVGDRVYFGYDQYDLTSEARDTLRRQASWLNAYPGTRVRVAGNCDERGTRDYNLALGARRAQSAKDFLVSLGVSADRIETVSYGKERPIDPRANAEGWAVNRNSHTEITSGAAIG